MWGRHLSAPRGVRTATELGSPPTLELGKVSLKKVGSQDSRMKKEQAAESWERMAALRGWVPLRPTAPDPGAPEAPATLAPLSVGARDTQGPHPHPLPTREATL